VDEIVELYKLAGSRDVNPTRRWQVEVAAEMIHDEMERRLKANALVIRRNEYEIPAQNGDET
jgi:hypothetical protein